MLLSLPDILADDAHDDDGEWDTLAEDNERRTYNGTGGRGLQDTRGLKSETGLSWPQLLQPCTLVQQQEAPVCIFGTCG